MPDDLYLLGGLGMQIEAHWKEYRPKMYEALRQAGTLRASVYAANELTANALDNLLFVKKMPYDMAWELVREEWAFLPDEEDVPELGVDPSRFPDLLPETSASPTPTPSDAGLLPPRPEETSMPSGSSSRSRPMPGRQPPTNRPS